MFLNYHNIANNYQPNNLIKSFPHSYEESKLAPVEASKPFEEYNIKGELIGYFWRYGETLNLEFNIDGEITLESDALIYKSHGVGPTENTFAKVGQRAYNLLDLTSWTCVARVSANKYLWEQDAEFTYPNNGAKKVYISAEDYLKDKFIDVTLYNFRMEPIHTYTTSATASIIFPIDKDLSKTLVKGIYYCSVQVYNEEVSFNIFDSNDCKLLVK